MAKTLTVYTLEELKEQFPEAYERVHERWKESVAGDQAPWSDETMDSLRATIEACGGTLRDWSIGPYGPSHVRVDAEDIDEVATEEAEDEDGEGPEILKDEEWLYREVLQSLGYERDERGNVVQFPGLCPFTGYYADEDFLESVYKAMKDGGTLTEALEGLASDAQRLMEADIEQQQEEESMLANWGDCHFTEDGTEV